MPTAPKVVGIMTAGELSSCGSSLYHQADSHWDHIVIQSYSSAMFSEVAIRSIPLHCEDIRSGNVTMTRKRARCKIRSRIQTYKCTFRYQLPRYAGSDVF